MTRGTLTATALFALLTGCEQYTPPCAAAAVGESQAPFLDDFALWDAHVASTPTGGIQISYQSADGTGRLFEIGPDGAPRSQRTAVRSTDWAVRRAPTFTWFGDAGAWIHPGTAEQRLGRASGRLGHGLRLELVVHVSSESGGDGTLVLPLTECGSVSVRHHAEAVEDTLRIVVSTECLHGGETLHWYFLVSQEAELLEAGAHPTGARRAGDPYADGRWAGLFSMSHREELRLSEGDYELVVDVRKGRVRSRVVRGSVEGPIRPIANAEGVLTGRWVGVERAAFVVGTESDDEWVREVPSGDHHLLLLDITGEKIGADVPLGPLWPTGMIAADESGRSISVHTMEGARIATTQVVCDEP